MGGNESNMAVMEVSLPSGFTVDSDALPSLQLSQNVKRVETKDGDTVVMLYFDKVILFIFNHTQIVALTFSFIRNLFLTFCLKRVIFIVLDDKERVLPNSVCLQNSQGSLAETSSCLNL